MLERSTRQLDAVSEVEIPPDLWRALTAGVAAMTQQLFPRGRVALRILDDPAIQSLNRQFRAVDAPTDVLSFPAAPGSPEAHVGDIALSWPTALRQSALNGNAPLDEALALVAHGLLHLAGHDHDTAAADAAMHAATLELLLVANTEVTTFGH